jgi:hypothetical protein
MRPLLADPTLRPSAAHIARARAHLLEALAIRKSSPLFRLQTAEEVQTRLRFYNTGPGQLPGLIAFGLADDDGSIDRRFGVVMSLVNASPAPQTLVVAEMAGRNFRLHPVLQGSSDPVVRTASFDRATGAFTVPGRTAVVFVAARGGRE